jgi:hypothetical protein
MKPLNKRAKIALALLLLTVLWEVDAQTAQTTTKTTAPATQPAKSTGDSTIYIFFKIFLSQVFSKMFFTAILLGFIYGPGFAVLAYEFGIIISCLLAATVGKVFDILPAFIFNVLNAFMYFIFGFHSFLYVYDEKTKEKYEDVPDAFKPALGAVEEFERKSETKTEKGDDEEKLSMVEKVQKDMVKKAANQMVDDTKG